MKNFLPLQCVLLFSVVLFLSFMSTCVAFEDCDHQHFKCNQSAVCIPMNWRCDGDDDCNKDSVVNDRSDEANCPAKTCSSDEFKCETDGQCIPSRWACDEDADCADGSDEGAHCGEVYSGTCRANEFDCGGLCVPQIWRCDGQVDCTPDGQDEKDCDESLINTCSNDEFRCVKDGRCINNIWYCDGDEDCVDGSDEAGCKIQCKEGQFNCTDGLKCIESNWKCDGDFDCHDHSDEKDCDEVFDAEGNICSNTDFTCASGDECIHESWKCDGDTDCLDGSDEGPFCEYPQCRDDQFQCGDHNCIPEDLRCNGFDECPDASDELNCTKKTCVENDEFDCYGDGSECIPLSKVCNGINDCQHREDEETAMCLHTDPCLKHTCDKHSKCIKVYPNPGQRAEAKCECDPGFELRDDGFCYDIDECQNGASCSQICKNLEGSYKCSCHHGYHLEQNTFCRAKGEYPWLYYANRRDIRRLRVDSRFMEIIVEKTDNSIALDIDYNDSRIFWTDGAAAQILSAKLNEGVMLANDQRTVLADGVHSPDGLAVDWLFKHLYWTDTGHDTISVANYDGTKKRTLISSGLDDPRAISLDPMNGYMYWTDWGQAPKIERCGMDGQNRETIVRQQDELEWPNGLTIDYIDQKIYWIDAKLHKIGTANMDGSDSKFVLVDPSEISRPFSISVFEDSLYWTDWNTNSIRKVNKHTGRSILTLSLGSYSVMDIKVYHEMRQERHFAENATALCNSKQCQFMCLPAAKVNAMTPLTVSCVCANGFELNADQRTCRKSAITPAPEVTTTTKKITTPKPVHTTKTPVVVVTTGQSGYTVVTENKTESGPKVQPEGPSGIIAVVTAVVVAVVLIAVFAIGCLVFRRWNSKNRKSMNFDNPVYRKTTTTDDHCMLEEEGQIHIPSQMQPLTGKEHV